MKKIKQLREKIENNKIISYSYETIRVLCVIILFAIIVVLLVQKFSNNNIGIDGYRAFSVASASMKKEYAVGDIIIIKETPPEKLKIGDDVTYLGKADDVKGLLITHRIVSIRKENDEYFFTTKGTSNKMEDAEISSSQIYGKVVYKTVVFSFLGRIMSNMYAYYILFTIVGVILSYRIVRVVCADKDDDEDEEEEIKNNSKESKKGN